MPRPCDHSEPLCTPGRPYAPGDCRVCWLWLHDGAYRTLWGGTGPPVRVEGVTPVAQAPGGVRAAPCYHLGKVLERPAECQHCWLRACELHGRCTTGTPLEGVACCASCPDYEPEAPAAAGEPFPVRHLLYHVMPIRFNGVWQRNLDQIKQRIGLFTGRRVVAVVTKGPGTFQQLDPPEAVEEYMRGTGCEFIVKENDPGLREVHTFHDLMGRVETRDPGHVAFFAHAKGVTRPVDPGVSVHPWARVLYETSLDYWGLAEEVLRTHPVAGPLKKNGHAFDGSASGWHYSGGFCWLRCADVFARDWRRIDTAWWGTESWPGTHFAPHEAGVLFHEGVAAGFGAGGLDMYEMQYVQKVVYPELRQWRRDNAHHRRAWP